MKVLVSGKNSQIGKELQLLSSNQKHDLIFLDSSDMKLLNMVQIKDVIMSSNPDMIINLSAFTDVEKSETNKDEAYMINSEAPAFISSLASDIKSRIIHVSSDYVFGNNDNAPFNSNSKPGPVNFYGETKLKGEQGVLNNNNMSIIIRTASVFSSHNSNFIKSIYSKLISNEKINVIDDQNINLTHAEDLAQLIIDLINLVSNKTILQNNEPLVFHYTNVGYTTWFDVANYIRKQIAIKQKYLEEINPIKSIDWESKASRSKDTRLEIDYSLLNSLDIKLYNWEKKVSDVLNVLYKNGNN